jgi:PEP-CTERM motif
MRGRILGVAVTTVIAAALVGPPASGKSRPRDIDFLGSGTTPGGKLTYTTEPGGVLSVTDDPIQKMIASPPSGESTLTVTDGSLSFTTGPCVTGCFTRVSGKGTASSPYSYSATSTFADTGTNTGKLILTGEIAGMTSPQILLEGTFGPGLNSAAKPGESAPYISMSSKGTGGFSGSLEITDINQTIFQDFEALGVLFSGPTGDGSSYMSTMLMSLSFSPGGVVVNHQTTGTWSGQVTSADLDVDPTPEPSSLLLMGSVLLVAAGFLRRRLLAA